MTNSCSTALIFGSTGLVGSFLLQALLKSESFTKIIAVTRQPLEINNQKLENVVCDFKDLDADLKDISADHVFCCLGTTIKKAGNKAAFRHVDFDLPVQIAHIMKRAGARHFSVVSALGADANSRIFYNQVKGHLEQAVLAANYEYTTILRPSLLLGDRKEKRLGESLSIKASAFVSPFMLGPLKSIRPVQAESVARSMLQDAIEITNAKREKGAHIIESKEIFINQ
jgi:uncharacterized protein YbjT (DUF2867 family)